MPQPTLLMIRPLAQGMDFVQALTALTGKMPTTLYAPVINTQSVPFTPPTSAQYLLFSSVNGVKFFAAETEDRSTPALCVGDTTAAAATDAGFTAQSAGGTAADLVELASDLADPAKGLLIYVSGALVAHDIDGQLANAGFQTARCIVYDQSPQPLTQQARAALKTPTIIPVSSPNTARIFAEQTADSDLSQVTLVFISENARAPLAHTKASQILAESPTRNAMIRAIAPLL